METGLLNLKWGRQLMEALVSFGVKEIVSSPGSRSTPLTLAACSMRELNTHTILDERSAGFFALGLAKASGCPVGLICTSGTAVANYYPAVIEASLNDIPLVLLTADRPSELRDLRPGQTINQINIYGSFVRYFTDLPIPQVNEDELKKLAEELSQAGSWLNQFGKGPVHINCPFREPLSPEEREMSVEGFGIEVVRGLRNSGESEVISPSLPKRSLIIAGAVAQGFHENDLATLARISSERGWPILADASFPARHRSDLFPYLIVSYDLILRRNQMEDLNPDGLLIIGEPPTCKILREYFSNWSGSAVQIPAVAANVNPMNLSLDRFESGLEMFLTKQNSTPIDTAFVNSWMNADKEQFEYVETFFNHPHSFFEGDVYRLASGQFSDRTPIVVANSLAIRDVEWFWPMNNRGFIFQTMRGANGIDGTLSFARGSITGFNQSGVLLTGDLAFLHDSNGLLQAESQFPSLLVILLNNGGGGIFNLLPISKWEPPFEKRFATPQRIDFKMLCQAHSIPHQLVTKKEELDLFEWKPPVRGIEVVEIQIDRYESTKTRKDFLNP